MTSQQHISKLFYTVIDIKKRALYQYPKMPTCFKPQSCPCYKYITMPIISNPTNMPRPISQHAATCQDKAKHYTSTTQTLHKHNSNDTRHACQGQATDFTSRTQMTQNKRVQIKSRDPQVQLKSQDMRVKIKPRDSQAQFK